MQELRADMREGNKPKNCTTCWEDESQGKESKREFYNNLIINSYGIDVDFNEEPEQPKDLQIAISNVCNLKCRTCAAPYSSKWVKESNDRKIKVWTAPTKSDVHNFETSKFWSDIDNWSKSVRRLEIMGGEPFYTKEFKKLIDHLIANGTSKNINLNLSTNGTIFDEELIDKIITNFNGLGFNISIDGIGDHFDLIRHGNNWNNVKSNLDKFYDLYMKQECTEAEVWKLSKLSIGITITISNMNFHYLRDIHAFFEDNCPKFKIWNNSVYFPEHYSSNNIPDHLKAKYIDRVINPENYGLPKWDDAKFKDCIQPLVNHATKEYNKNSWSAFVKESTAAVAYRQEKFENTFPELFDIVKPAWTTRLA